MLLITYAILSFINCPIERALLIKAANDSF